MSRALDVYLHGGHVATVVQGQGGALELRYTEAHTETSRASLSLSLPIREAAFRNKVVRSYLEGLVPEAQSVREAIGRDFGVSPRSAFALLRYIGLDCAGAVQFINAGEELPQGGELIALSEQEIGSRLKDLRSGLEPSWVRKNEHWSLGGAQTKFTLTKNQGSWHRALGVWPSTHIVKPGIQDLKAQALNEHVCLTVARMIGIPAAETVYHEFDGEPAVVVTRFDRYWDGDVLRRTHQEDMCQALGILPTRKYESDGGPSAIDIVNKLRLASTPTAAETNVLSFVQGLIYNCLIGAPDAHAKNYSIFLDSQGLPRVTPLYDVASSLAYRRSQADDQVIPQGRNTVLELGRSAMKIAGASEFPYISGARWRNFAKRAQVEEDLIIDLIRLYAALIPDAFSDVFKVQAGASVNELETRLVPNVAQLCSVVGHSL